MVKSIHKILILVNFLYASTHAQTSLVRLWDTSCYADAVYLDPINQVYAVYNQDKRIIKYNLQFKILKQVSFNQGLDHAILDVSDPFKCILYYPGDYKIFILDESLAVISTYDEPELNSQSVVCHYSTDQIGIFSNYGLKIKNYAQQKVLNSAPVFNQPGHTSDFPFRLKQSKDYLYLLRPGIGISKYNHQLFEEKTWLNSTAENLDVSDDEIYYTQKNVIIRLNTKWMTEEIILKTESPILFFSVNAENLLLLSDHRLQLYQWK